MPVPSMQQQYLGNIAQQFTALAAQVQKIPVSPNAPNPASSLVTISGCLAAVSARLTQCIQAGQVSAADRHYMGAQFQTIANELNK